MLRPPLDDFYRFVSDEATRLECGCWLVLRGFNKDGEPQMYSIDGAGTSSCLTSVGMHAIGGGWTFALGRLLSIDLDRDTPLERVLYQAFHARADAEVIQGVGYEWDAVIVTTTGAVEVSTPIKELCQVDRGLRGTTSAPHPPILAHQLVPDSITEVRSST